MVARSRRDSRYLHARFHIPRRNKYQILWLRVRVFAKSAY